MRKINKENSNFAEWTYEALVRLLGMEKKVYGTPAFEEWTTVSGEIPTNLKPILEDLRVELILSGNAWNETELLMGFIAPLLSLVKYKGDRFNAFAERKLSAVVGEYQVSGNVDWMTAYGLSEPETPYFFIHEYKRMKGAEADPEGQLLIEMLAAQKLNNDGFPVYGCYVIGKYWSFLLLEGDKYSVSEGYDATKPEELTTIWLILIKTKQLIVERAAQNNA